MARQTGEATGILEVLTTGQAGALQAILPRLLGEESKARRVLWGKGERLKGGRCEA